MVGNLDKVSLKFFFIFFIYVAKAGIAFLLFWLFGRAMGPSPLCVRFILPLRGGSVACWTSLQEKWNPQHTRYVLHSRSTLTLKKESDCHFLICWRQVNPVKHNYGINILIKYSWYIEHTLSSTNWKNNNTTRVWTTKLPPNLMVLFW